MTAPPACPCGRGVAYDECCGPIHQRTVAAATAEDLMRARYSAFVRRDEEFLLWSWHPDHRPDQVAVTGEEQWLGLEVVAAKQGGADDDKGTVEFIARFALDGTPRALHEVSRFVRLDQKWVYLKGRDVSL